MKKLILFTFLILGVLSLMSYQGGFGAGTGGTQGATTAPGEAGATCGQGGCHNAGMFSPSLDVLLIDEDGQQNEKYVPGETYTVALKINHTGLPVGYGFQMVCLTENGDASINNFSDFPPDVGDISIDGRQYVEQSKTIPSDSIFMSWTAPAKETGSVVFYAVGNAVNGNSSPSGDGAATGNFVFEEDVESSTQNLRVDNIDLYPNPASDFIFIPENILVESYEVHDFSGRKILIGSDNSLEIASLENGAYILKIIDKEGMIYADRFLKI